MSGPIVIGPQTAVAGTVLSYSVPAETVALYIQNYSKLTLLISFGASQPTATDSLNNQYDGVLAAGGRDVFYVQGRGASPFERSLNAMGAFTGQVWIMPIDRTGSQATTGSASQMADIWLSAYGPYDPLPPFPGGMPLNVDLSSQPRIISIPVPLSNWNTVRWLSTDPNPLTIQTFTMTPAQQAAGLMAVYLYYCVVSPEATAATSMTFTFEMQWQDAANNNLGSPLIFIRGGVTTNNTGTTATPFTFNPAFPLGAVGRAPANADHALILVRAQNGTRVNLNITLVIMNDPNNTAGIPSIGATPYFSSIKPLF